MLWMLLLFVIIVMVILSHSGKSDLKDIINNNVNLMHTTPNASKDIEK